MPTDRKDPTEQEILIEEKKTLANGEVHVRKYIKGRFLGKVSKYIYIYNAIRILMTKF